MTHRNDTSEGRVLTGRHVLTLFVGGFGIIIAVNIYMAFMAISTFPGLEVSSSYADSQTFNDRRAAQEALGWTASVALNDNGDRLFLTLEDAEGRAVTPRHLDAVLTRPTHRREDQTLMLSRVANGFTAPVDLGPGVWRLRLTGAAQDGTEYRRNLTFRYFP